MTDDEGYSTGVHIMLLLFDNKMQKYVHQQCYTFARILRFYEYDEN